MNWIQLVSATVECPLCPQRFHQIDSTEERARSVVRVALARHLTYAHPDASPCGPGGST
jgi:hypothetical protein